MGGTKAVTAAQETERGEPEPPSRAAKVEELYRRHGSEVFGFLVKLCGRRGLAEDWLQETFLRAYRGLADREPSKLRAWLFVIARNVAIDGFRKEDKIRRLEQAAAAPIAAPPSSEGAAESAERRALVAEALEELDLEDRSLVMWRARDLSTRDICDALGCSPPTARRRVAAAIAALSRALSRRRIREGGDL